VNTEQASKDRDARADLAVFQGRPPSSGEEATNAPSDLAGVVVSRMVNLLSRAEKAGNNGTLRASLNVIRLGPFGPAIQLERRFFGAD